MEKNSSLRKKYDAFSLAEMILILVFVAILALGSGILLPKKMKSKTAQQQHGLFACTVIAGQQHYFKSNDMNAEIPEPDSSKWKSGNCKENFDVPKYANMLMVTMIGGGGAGKNGSVIWDKEKDIPDGHLVVDGDSYSVEYDGWYHIKMYGQRGEQTHRTPWRNGDCFTESPHGGYTYRFEGDIKLKRGDKLTLELTEKLDNIMTSFACTDGRFIPGDGEYYIGKDGGNAILKLNSSVIANIQGSGAGYIRCNPLNNECVNRYDAYQGEPGKAIVPPTGFSNLVELDPATNPSAQVLELNDGRVDITYSETMNESNREFTANGGCGGEAGSTNATLYPIIRAEIPSITIGLGGTQTTAATATMFGTFPAPGGRNGTACADVAATSGADGEAATGYKDLPSTGGAGAKGKGESGASASKVNGEAGKGFGAGGGGGSIFYNSTPSYINYLTADENKQPVIGGNRRWYQGNGGNGTNGIVVITW